MRMPNRLNLRDTERRLALAFQAGCVVAVGLYAVVRLIQAVLYKEPNPATVIWSAHAGYFWRVWTVCYAGVMAGFLAFAAARDREALVCRTILRGLYAAALLIVLQGLLVP